MYVQRFGLDEEKIWLPLLATETTLFIVSVSIVTTVLHKYMFDKSIVMSTKGLKGLNISYYFTGH